MNHLVASMADEEEEMYRRRRQVLRREERERLLRYVRSIIDQNKTPLRDILREHALPHLPVQSLRRFLLVSRSWHAHLSASPFFSHTQSHTHRSLSGFFFHLSYLPLDPRSGSIPDPSFSFVPDSASLVASSNGLVACESRHASSRCYVCNPSTQDSTALPRSPQTSRVVGTALVFQPSALAFSADYYVVRVDYPSTLCSLHVFSSTLGTWKTSVVRMPKPRKPWSTVAAEGVAYWPNEDETVSRYDPKADKLTVVDRPQTEMGRWRLAEMGGRLCCVAGKEGMVAVWGLERGRTDKWRELVRVEMEGDPWPLVSEGKEERAVVHAHGRIVGIDVRSGELTVIREGSVMEPDACLPYISSLVAVKEFCFGEGCFTCKHGCSYS